MSLLVPNTKECKNKLSVGLSPHFDKSSLNGTEYVGVARQVESPPQWVSVAPTHYIWACSRWQLSSGCCKCSVSAIHGLPWRRFWRNRSCPLKVSFTPESQNRVLSVPLFRHHKQSLCNCSRACWPAGLPKHRDFLLGVGLPGRAVAHQRSVRLYCCVMPFWSFSHMSPVAAHVEFLDPSFLSPCIGQFSDVVVESFWRPSGSRPQDGVRDMIVISDIDENGINVNLQTRYKNDTIYVSFRNDDDNNNDANK